MDQEVKKFNSLIECTSKVIADPSKSIKETMIAAGLGVTATASVLVLSASTLSVLFGPAVALPVLLGRIAKHFRGKKREQEEKNRMYREVIKKQQAAINKQKEINRKLEEELRKAKEQNESNSKKISFLEQQIRNLKEVIDILSKQKEQFEMAA